MYGKHAVLAALGNPRRTVEQVRLTKEMLPFAEKALVHFGTPHQIVTKEDLVSRLGPDAVHQGISAYVQYLEPESIDFLYDKQILLILDQVTDPHNVGAIFRSAAAFGIGGIIMQKQNSPEETAVMAKAASGGLELVPRVDVSNLSQTISVLKEQGFWCLGLDGGAKTALHKAPSYDKTVLVLGSEGKGLRPLVAEHCDLLVKLPISLHMESLNVSNATAIALYQVAVLGRERS